MPITRTEDAKEGGFAQVREVLQKFKGLVTGVTFDMWGGQLIDEEGRKRQPREFLEIAFTGVEVLETTEELNMDISEEWSIRVNCSDFKNSFWVDMFLASADKFKVLIPDGLKDKIVTMEKQTLEANDPKYNATGWVIAGVESAGTTTTKTTKSTTATREVAGEASNPMDTVEALAIGKTEDELKAAIPDALKGDPMLPLAQAGLMTQALINEKRIALVDGKYQKPA